MEIKVQQLTEDEIAERGVRDWPIWTCEASEFPWTYDSMEECLLLEGEVEVTPDGGQPVSFGAGDFVTFPKGMSCFWKVTKPVRKHYDFK